MTKGFKKTIAALIVVSALFAASILAPAASSTIGDGQVVGFFFGDIIEGT